MKAKRIVIAALAAAMTMSVIAGCGDSTEDANGTANTNKTSESTNDGSDFDTSKEIGVISREEGSGTRGAFEELFEVEETTANAVITSSTAVMMTTVSGDPYSIGYISLGSLNNTVKALKIDGVDATVENVENDTYKVSRPFNIATKDGLSEAAQDFVDFIMSADGQAVIEENGYVSVSDAEAYSGTVSSGKVVIHGSSSVTPVMEKLQEAYNEKNPGVTVEVQQSDSSTGITDTIDGTCDIGMASRALKEEELAEGLTSTTIAMDGVAVIVNNDCPVDGLTSEQVNKIFTGEATVWSDVIGE